MTAGPPKDAFLQLPDAITGGPAHVPIQRPAIFDVPRGLEPRIAFWHDIFSRYHSRQYVIHDIDQVDLIYLVVEVYPQPGEGRRAHRRRVRAVLKHRKKRIADLITALQQSPPGKIAKRDRALAKKIKRLHQRFPRHAIGAAERLHAQRGQADRFRRGLLACLPLKGEIEHILASHGVPHEMYWLVYVETMCDPRAYSHVGAAGLWQLMPGSARELGMTVTRKKDERLDVLAATHTAARIFRRNHRMLKRWSLAITGYNHGHYGVKRMVAKHKTRRLDRLIVLTRKRSFGYASKNFFAEFIAALRLGMQMEGSGGVGGSDS